MSEKISYDVVVVGGGMAGICASIASARGGAKTALIHNRPVLGGNASSEIRMHICGADHHMQRENARETGILEEILLENKRRNPEMVYPIFDTVLWEKVHFQENLTLYLNTHMEEVHMNGNFVDEIKAVQLTTEKEFLIKGKYFIDTTGDASLGAKAGAEYRIGREAVSEFGESLAPVNSDHCTMGNSLMFKARDMGKPVVFEKPFWANTYTEEQLKLRDHSEITSGYWWIELGGGKYDTIHNAELLRDELLKAVYGVWDHIKNGGNHGAEQMELEWVGFLPGKRESRRMVGDYILTQQDCVAGTIFEDAVAYGGWPMDIHTVEGFLTEDDNPTVWNQVNNIYSIPYRSLYSKNISNLFLGGRAISCSHVAFSSTRVMATCAVAGQAAGTAAAMSLAKGGIMPREMTGYIEELQQELLKNDCYIPGIKNEDSLDIARTAKITASYKKKGYEPENVINGYTRTNEHGNNCYKAPSHKEAVLSFQWDKEHILKEIRILFDSNLSREIMPSLSDSVMKRQIQGPPPELVKDYEITFLCGGAETGKMCMNSGGQRLQIIHPDKVTADSMQIKCLTTYGAEDITIFEVRAYEY